MIAHGHHHADIPRYTRRQIDLFYREALARERAARADRIEDLALAFHGKHAAKAAAKLRQR